MAVLTHRSVTRTLFSMAFPMLAGTFAMNAYQLTDAWFVSRLGTLPLAAMGFVYPVVILLTFVAGGLGVGVTTLASHAIGRHDHSDAARLGCNVVSGSLCSRGGKESRGTSPRPMAGACEPFYCDGSGARQPEIGCFCSHNGTIA